MKRLTPPTLIATMALALVACAPDPAQDVGGAAVSAPVEELGGAVGDEAAAPEDQSIDEAQPLDAPAKIIALTGTVGFTASKITRAHECTFGTWTGTLDPGAGTPETAALTFVVDTASLSCDPDESGPMHEKFHKHLLSEDFLAVEQHPEATFTSTSIASDPTAPDTYVVTGDLTILGITRSITFPATVAVTDGAVRANAEFSLDRREWNLVYPGAPDDLIRDQFVMRLALEGNR